MIETRVANGTATRASPNPNADRINVARKITATTGRIGHSNPMSFSWHSSLPATADDGTKHPVILDVFLHGHHARRAARFSAMNGKWCRTCRTCRTAWRTGCCGGCRCQPDLSVIEQGSKRSNCLPNAPQDESDVRVNLIGSNTHTTTTTLPLTTLRPPTHKSKSDIPPAAKADDRTTPTRSSGGGHQRNKTVLSMRPAIASLVKCGPGWDRPLILYVARVQRRGRLEQQNVRLLFGDGPMFNATRHDQELACYQPDVPIPKLHAKPALDDEEEFVLVVVVVPDERPLELDQLHLLAVQLADNLRLPLVAELRQLLAEVHLVHDRLRLTGASSSSWP